MPWCPVWEPWCAVSMQHSQKEIQNTPGRGTYFAPELSCFRMLRDCRSMLAVESNQLFYLTFSARLSLRRYTPCSKNVQPCYFIRGEEAQTSPLCLCGCCSCVCLFVCAWLARKFSFLFQECALDTSQWMRKLHIRGVSCVCVWGLQLPHYELKVRFRFILKAHH